MKENSKMVALYYGAQEGIFFCRISSDGETSKLIEVYPQYSLEAVHSMCEVKAECLERGVPVSTKVGGFFIIKKEGKAVITPQSPHFEEGELWCKFAKTKDAMSLTDKELASLKLSLTLGSLGTLDDALESGKAMHL